MQPTPTVLLIEDDAQIRLFIRQALADEGWRVLEAASGEVGLALARAHAVDLVLLDLGLPDLDGTEVLARLKASHPAAVIVLSARTQERDKVQALDAGADDYLPKPFGLAELLARVRVRQRHRAAQGGGGGGSVGAGAGTSAAGSFAEPLPGDEIVAFGAVRVDLAARRVTLKGEIVRLTPIEYRLLQALLAHPDRVLTQRQLLATVWGGAYVERTHYLRVHMGHLRHKLEADPAQPRHLVTEPGVGYRFLP